MSGFFVTGIGTGVGKTFTTCAMLHAAPGSAAFKPIVTGDPEDTRLIIEASGHGTLDAISPWRYAAPISPHLASARENRAIHPEALIDWSARAMARPGLNFIEGVGGVMVPLAGQFTTLDWMVALNLPVILVAGSYLGSLSHTLTAIDVLRSRNLDIAALVVSESQGSPVTLAETISTLNTFANDIPLRVAQPFVSSYQDATHIHQLVTSWI